MLKYFAFARVVIKENFKNVSNLLGTLLSFIIHIIIFSFLWDFVLEGKAISGYTKKELIWYVIIAESIMYSFHYYYRKVATKVEMGDFAYDMTKPYNFLIRTIVEGIAEIPITATILVIGVVLGLLLVGSITISITQVLLCFLVFVMSTILLLLLNIIVGLLSIWLGRDVSSLWLLIQKAMLIFAFSPIELFPKNLQKILLLLPTTHVIYTPSSLFVHFSATKVLISLCFEIISFIILGILLFIIYKKGVKKQNVNGI